MPEKRGNSDVRGVKALAFLPLPTAVLPSVFSGLRGGRFRAEGPLPQALKAVSPPPPYFRSPNTC